MRHSFAATRMFGTGLTCGGLLVFQILSTRLLSVVLDEYLIIFAISFAMLGMGAATSLTSVIPRKAVVEASARLCWLSMALGLSYVLTLYLITDINDQFNEATDAASREGGFALMIATIQQTAMVKMLIVGTILFLPYFLFGIFIANLFGTAAPNEYHKLYAADLIGAAVGCLLAVLSIDYLGFQGSVALILLSTFAGATAFGFGISRAGVIANVLAGVAVLGSFAYPSLFERLEPSPNLTALARNYDQTSSVTVGWHAWNAHSRIGLLELRDIESGKRRQVYAHESGSGWAGVPSFDSASLVDNSRLASITTALAPARVLVLFAGVGADMVAIDAACHGNCDISGVEINRSMVNHALANSDPRFREFLARPNIQLHVAEAREFLERDQTKYDAILLSWWGAGASHYVGTAGKLAEYLYTKEGFAALIDHLTPTGTIVIYNGSKAQSIVTFGSLFAERGMGNLDGHVVVLRGRPEHQEMTNKTGFFDRLENMRLVVKPSGFDERDVATIRTVADELDSEVILFPGGNLPGYDLYLDLANGGDLEAINATLSEQFDVELTVATDDRPFSNDLVPRSKFFSVTAWLNPVSNNPVWNVTRVLINFVMLLSVASIVLIVGPLCLPFGPRRTPSNFVRLFYFAALGAGFMAVEIGLVRKFGLILGHPSYAISIVLASLIISTGFGALASQRLSQSRVMTEKLIAALVAVYVVVFTVSYPIFFSAMISLPLLLKGGLVVIILFPLGFFMGQLFPRALEQAGREDSQSVPWAWAINGTSSTIGSAVVFLISFPLGFDAALFLGAAIYGSILFLPLGRQRLEVTATEAAPAE